MELTFLCTGEKDQDNGSQDVPNHEKSSEKVDSSIEVDAEDAAISGADKNTDQLIINAVKLRPSLWDPVSKKTTPSAIWNQWEMVCTKIGVSTTQREKVKAQWSNLRNRYMKANKTFTKYKESGKAAKAQKRQLLGSDCSAESERPFKSGFIYFEEMSFLSDTVAVPE